MSLHVLHNLYDRTLMEKLPNKDIERMITFINHEVEEKLKEIEIKGIQEYNSEKARLIKEHTDKIEDQFINSQKDIESRKFRTEGQIISKYRKMYLNKKSELLKQLISKLEDKLKNEKLTKKLVDQTFEKVKFNNDGSFVYCLKKDKKMLKDKTSVEIKEMEEKALGGIIVVSKDGKTIVDNSYATRIAVINDQFISDIINVFFNKVNRE